MERKGPSLRSMGDWVAPNYHNLWVAPNYHNLLTTTEKKNTIMVVLKKRLLKRRGYMIPIIRKEQNEK